MTHMYTDFSPVQKLFQVDSQKKFNVRRVTIFKNFGKMSHIDFEWDKFTEIFFVNINKEETFLYSQQ